MKKTRIQTPLLATTFLLSCCLLDGISLLYHLSFLSPNLANLWSTLSTRSGQKKNKWSDRQWHLLEIEWRTPCPNPLNFSIPILLPCSSSWILFVLYLLSISTTYESLINATCSIQSEAREEDPNPNYLLSSIPVVFPCCLLDGIFAPYPSSLSPLPCFPSRACSPHMHKAPSLQGARQEHVEADCRPVLIADSPCPLAAGPIQRHHGDSHVEPNPLCRSSSSLHRRMPTPTVLPPPVCSILTTVPTRAFLGSVSVRIPPCLFPPLPLYRLFMFAVAADIVCRYSMLISFWVPCYYKSRRPSRTPGAGVYRHACFCPYRQVKLPTRWTCLAWTADQNHSHRVHCFHQYLICSSIFNYLINLLSFHSTSANSPDSHHWISPKHLVVLFFLELYGHCRLVSY